jgi:periplasmic protein TonB
MGLCLLVGVRAEAAEKQTHNTSQAAPSAQSETLPAGVRRAGDGVSVPKPIYTPEAEYAEKARKKKLSGYCKMSLIVDTDGHVRDVRVIHSVAEDQPKKLRAAALALDEKAMEAVRQYRFEPGLLEGKPVPVTLTVAINFQIF